MFLRPDRVGGFVGYLQDTSINSSYANGMVTSTMALNGSLANSQAGGFVGELLRGTITSSRAAGAVFGPGRVGGFVAQMNDVGSIYQSYATGAVTQTSNSTIGNSGGVGGFAGYLDTGYRGTIANFYAMGAVAGTQNVGGLIGYAGRAILTNGYATGMVTINAATLPATVYKGAVFGKLDTSFTNNTNATLNVTASGLYLGQHHFQLNVG
jgi:hypothetical protein